MSFILDIIHEFLAPVASLAAGGYAYMMLTESEDDVHAVRVACGASTAAVALVYFLIMMVKGRPGNGNEEIITIRTGGKTYHTPKRKHDADNAQSKLIWLGVGTAFLVTMHIKLGVIVPLAMQAALQPILLLQSAIFNVCVLNRSATGHLQRPWDNESVFSQVSTDMRKMKKQFQDMQSEMAGEKVSRRLTASERRNRNRVARRKR
mmetsp:Transcript_1103/g.1455  ORF Transcript_1103/g.1455 Transcript_1103/m.1455 type:complete len:206 (-) Transcript_1103:167-784(-)